ncbi:MAG: hypothetical protein WD894_19560 [Pirellulales bacterium]
MGDRARPPRFQTPRDDGGKLVAPPVSAGAELIAAHRARLEACDYDVHGQSLPDLAAEARRQLLAEALAYTRAYRDVSSLEQSGGIAAQPSLVLAGHQPELFHPGVWLKNFMLHSVARASGAVAVNLVVDSDTIKASSLRVPTGSATRPLVESVLFDRPTTAVPFEERRIVDRALFESFADRVADKLTTLVPRPLVKDFWPDVLSRSRHTDRLGECLAQARHVWEGRWGAATLEIPQSRVCSLPAFHRFAAHLLAHLPRLWEIYNAALFEYRSANHVRSHAHPVPELSAEGDWLEAPFWVWRADDPTRRRLFVRSRDNGIVLADRAGWEQPLDISAETNPDRAIEQLQELARLGVRLRTRALITTMLARVLLGDLFVHGIGGAKYDQMTDVLIEQFFGLEPPGYMVVSGTLRLPIEHNRGAAEELRRTRQALRELTYHPERFVEPPSQQRHCERCSGPAAKPANWELQRSIDMKRQWIAMAKSQDNARTRHEAIRSANLALQPWLSDCRAKLLADIERLERQARADAVLSSREYSLCLYPAHQLREFLSGAS